MDYTTSICFYMYIIELKDSYIQSYRLYIDACVFVCVYVCIIADNTECIA